jgi:hypothetical protein
MMYVCVCFIHARCMYVCIYFCFDEALYYENIVCITYVIHRVFVSMCVFAWRCMCMLYGYLCAQTLMHG